MRLKTIFLILFGIWFLDYMTTFIALNFMGASELNPFAAFFYSHWWGWIVFPIIAGTSLFLVSLIAFLGQNFIKGQFQKKKKKDWSFLIPTTLILLWIFIEGKAVIINLLNIIEG